MAKTWGKTKEYPLHDPKEMHNLIVKAADKWVNGKSLAEAEAEVAQEHEKDMHIRAAAHHFAHGKAAQGLGDMESAKMHNHMYKKHLEHSGASHQEVLKHLNNEHRPLSKYKFAPHGMDAKVKDEVNKE